MYRKNRFFLLLAFAISAAIFYASYSIQTRLIRYPLLSVSFIFALYGSYTLLPNTTKTPLVISSNIIDTIVFLMIVAVVYLSYSYPQTSLFPVAIVVLDIVIAARLIYIQTRIPLNILQIFLTAITARAGYFFSAASYGPDRFHRALPGYIMETGHLIPKEVIYYRFYPLGHIFGAVGGLLTSLGPDRAMLLFVSGSQVLGLIGVYLFTRHFLRDARLSLLAMLVVSNSAGPLLRGSQIFAQTYAIALIPFLIWLAVRQQTTKLFLIGLIFSISAFLGHHSIAFSIPMILISLFLGSYFLRLIPNCPQPKNIYPQLQFTRSLVLIMLVFITYYWLVIKQMRGQINRIALILSATSSTATAAVTQTAGLQPPTTVFFGVSLPPVLSWAAPLLALAIVVGFTGLVYARKMFGGAKKLPYTYMAASAICFGSFGLAFAIGGKTAVIRILPTITIFTTPLVAIASRELITKTGGPAIALVLCSIIFTAAVISPAVAIPDRSQNDFQPWQTDQGTTAGKWADKYGETIATGSNMQRYLYWKTISSGKIPEEKHYKSVLFHGTAQNTSEYNDYWKSSEHSIFIWQSYYYPYYQLTLPDNTSRIYTNGDDKIYYHQ